MPRCRVIFHGQVQGVFFRATSAQLAKRFAVTGWVRNLPDGTVELEAQGEEQEIAALLDAIGTHFAGNITESNESAIEPRETENGFTVRH